jgi:DNA-directed RNA polymerase specialized sigma24 family protein
MTTFMHLDQDERERLVSAAVSRCTRRLGYDVNRNDVDDMKQEARLQMWRVCRAQGRDAADYDDAGYLIACGTNAAWHHWRYFVLQTKCHGVPGKDGLTDCQRGGLPGITFPLDALDSDDGGPWEEVIPYWPDLVIDDITPLTTDTEPGRRSPLTDERWEILWRLLDTFYPRIRTLGKRRLLSILELLTEGYTTRNIADLFGISYQSVRKHRLRLQRFLAWLADLELPFDDQFPTDQFPAPDYSAVLQ